MRRITPSEFREAFASVVRGKAAQLHAQWMQHDAKAYTAFMRRDILPPIAHHLNLTPWCNGDYNLLDAILYEQADTEHFTSGTYAKALNVIIEHENARGRGTFVEINKLQHYNSALKVFVGYVSDDHEGEHLLKEYEKIIRDADIFDDIATLRRQLVIFGDNRREGRRWTFFSYEASGFLQQPALLLA
jgi:hypothetical protein